MTRLSDNYNLQKLCSDLAKEWHPTKNGKLSPRDVAPNSGKKVWWLCSKNQNHEWDAIIGNRNKGVGCPYCAGRKVRIDNCLKTINPQLAKEWHPTKNGKLSPKDVTPNSNKKVWWRCSKNKSHKWGAIISNRNRGRDCPYCSGKKACIDNCLRTINPQLAKEWHPTKNGTLTPKNVTPNSHKKVWWVCLKGHKWEAVISSRNRGSGCPYCFKKRRQLGHRRFKV